MRFIQFLCWKLLGLTVISRIDEDTPEARLYRRARRIAHSTGGVRRASIAP